MSMYGSTATAAGLVVPKNYIEKVGDDAFKQKPIGAGPYKFVSTTPGIEVVFEAFDKYWRKKPNIKNVVLRSVPDVDSRALMVKTGEADMAAALESVAAQGLIDNPGTRIVPSKHASCQWIEFPDQWDPKSPWHDMRMRQAVALRDRSRGDQQGGLSRLLPAGRGHHPARHGVHAAGRSRSRTTRKSRSSSSPRRAIRTASTPACSTRSPASRPPRKRSSTISTRPVSGSGWRRWSARRSTPTGRRRNSMACT